MANCPLCKRKLTKRHEGLVCKNWKCELYHKLGVGWFLMEKSKNSTYQYLKDKYDFNIERHENKKEWLRLKSLILTEKNRTCEVCGRTCNLHVHHILPRAECPNLSLDKENLMVVCESCHRELHRGDKHRYG